jgi:tetratricopeptide (TPR) repeat protein
MKQVMAFCLGLHASLLMPQGSEDQDLLARAHSLLERGEADQAIKLLEPFLANATAAKGPAEIQRRALTLLGLAHQARQDPETARASFEKALAAAGPRQDPDLLLALAQTSLDMHDAREAQRVLRLLDGEAQKEAEPSLLLALAHMQSGDNRAAEEIFKAVIEKAPSATALHSLGVILFDAGRFAEALKRFAQARQLAPGDYYSGIYQARCLLELQRLEEASKELETMARAFPTAEVSYLLGRTRLRQGRFEEAAASFGNAVAQSPSYAEAAYGLATALRRLEKNDEARQAMEKFQTLHRREMSLHHQRDALAQEGYRRSEDAGIFEDLGRAAVEAGDLEAAEGNLWQAVRLDPARRSARLLLARTFARSGRYQAAAVHYQKILRQDPESTEARRELEELVREHSRDRP